MSKETQTSVGDQVGERTASDGCQRMSSPGINGEGELRGQPANPGLPGKMAVKTVCVCLCLFTIQSGQWSVAEAERGVTGQGGVDDSPVSRAEQQTDAAGTRAGEDERETSRDGRPGSAGIATGLFLPPSPSPFIYSFHKYNKLCGRPPQYAPAPCKLTVDVLTLKAPCGLRGCKN